MLSGDKTFEAIARERNRRPFIPFALISTTGNRFIISEPTRIAVTNGKVVFASDTEGMTTLSTDQIASIEAGDEQEKLRQSIRERLVQQPFSPFSIVLTDGRRLPITRYLQAAVGLTTFLVGSPHADGNVARQYYLRDVRHLEGVIIA